MYDHSTFPAWRGWGRFRYHQQSVITAVGYYSNVHSYASECVLLSNFTGEKNRTFSASFSEKVVIECILPEFSGLKEYTVRFAILREIRVESGVENLQTFPTAESSLK